MGYIPKWLVGSVFMCYVWASAQAAEFTYTFALRVNEISLFTGQTYNGTLDRTLFPMGGQVSVGDILQGRFSFDQDKLVLPADSQTASSRYFWDATGEGHRIMLTTPQGARYTTPQKSSGGIVQLERGRNDFFAIGDYDPSFVIGLTVANWNGGVFKSLDLPGNMQLADMNYSWFGMSWTNASGQDVSVRGEFIALSPLSPVPEPDSWLCMCAGLVVLAYARQSIKRLQKRQHLSAKA